MSHNLLIKQRFARTRQQKQNLFFILLYTLFQVSAIQVRGRDHLRSGADERRAFSRVAGTVKDARDAVRLGQQSGVGHGETDADTETLDAADDRTRLGEYESSRLTWAGEKRVNRCLNVSAWRV